MAIPHTSGTCDLKDKVQLFQRIWKLTKGPWLWRYLYVLHVFPGHRYLAPHPSFAAEAPSLCSPLTRLGAPTRMFETCLRNRSSHLPSDASIFVLSCSKPLQWYSHRCKLVIDVGATDILNWIIICFGGEVGTVLSTVGCIAISLASTHQTAVATLPHPPTTSPQIVLTEKCLWTLPDVPCRKKLPLVENHWSQRKHRKAARRPSSLCLRSTVLSHVDTKGVSAHTVWLVAFPASPYSQVQAGLAWCYTASFCSTLGPRAYWPSTAKYSSSSSKAILCNKSLKAMLLCIKYLLEVLDSSFIHILFYCNPSS